MIKLTLNYENVARENGKPLRVPLLSRPRSLARSIIPSRLMMLMCVLCSSLLPKTKNDDDVSEWGTTMVSIPERMGSHGTEHNPEGDGKTENDGSSAVLFVSTMGECWKQPTDRRR